MGNDTLEQVSEFKYLGITTDNKLTWDKHIDNVTANAKYKLHLMRKNRAYVDRDLLKLMYTGLIRPCLEYCASLFNNLNIEQVRKLEVVQNDALRIILHKGRRDSATDMRKVLNVPTLQSRRKVKLAGVVYKALHGDAPQYLRDLLPSMSAESYTQCGGWDPQKFSLETYRASFEYQAIQVWNSISLKTKQCQTYEAFKTQARKELLTHEKGY